VGGLFDDCQITYAESYIINADFSRKCNASGRLLNYYVIGG
jgi:hypothetical protein